LSAVQAYMIKYSCTAFFGKEADKIMHFEMNLLLQVR